MPNEALVHAIKAIVALARSGRLDDAYAAYGDLFASPAFTTYRPEDQRQALKLMIQAKAAPGAPSAAMLEAHRKAIVALTELVSTQRDPVDHELLGICHVLLGNEAGASAIFKAGLAIERVEDPQSDLCGSLMKRIAAL